MLEETAAPPSPPDSSLQQLDPGTFIDPLLAIVTTPLHGVLIARSKSLVMGEHHGLPFRPCPPCPPEPVLKSGWLKKQRSLMKNWQQRWFVLRGDQLFYYKDQGEAKPQARKSGFSSPGLAHHAAPFSISMRRCETGPQSE
ncbi:UNVERIFIED_CONTAM: hypothetical protein K2H54_001708 [Gekko kuhli]